MASLSRRSFLTRGSLVVAAGGMVGAVPGLGSLLQVTEAEAPGVEGAATDAEIAASNSAPLVAHIKDLQSGEISLYQGESHITYKDPALAARLFRAAR